MSDLPASDHWVLRSLELIPNLVIISDHAPSVLDTGGLLFEDVLIFFKQSFTDEPVILERWIAQENPAQENPDSTPFKRYQVVLAEEFRNLGEYRQTYNGDVLLEPVIQTLKTISED